MVGRGGSNFVFNGQQFRLLNLRLAVKKRKGGRENKNEHDFRPVV
jgi:hypothetical protein